MISYNRVSVAQEARTEKRIGRALNRLVDDIRRSPPTLASLEKSLEKYRTDLELILRVDSFELSIVVGRMTIGYINERVRGAKGVLEVFEEAIIGWIIGHAAKQSQTIVGTLRKVLVDALLGAQEDGVGAQEAARRVAEAAGLTRSRAATIARTELHTAASNASRTAAQATGLDMVKEWGSAEDRRVRPDHATANGQEVEMDAPFIVGEDELLYPGDPAGSPEQIINCRCTAFYWPRVGGVILR